MVDTHSIVDVVGLLQRRSLRSADEVLEALSACNGHLLTADAVLSNWETFCEYRRNCPKSKQISKGDFPLKCVQTGEIVWISDKTDSLFASKRANVAQRAVQILVFGLLGSPREQPSPTPGVCFHQVSSLPATAVVARIEFLTQLADAKQAEHLRTKYAEV